MLLCVFSDKQTDVKRDLTVSAACVSLMLREYFVYLRATRFSLGGNIYSKLLLI